MSWKAVVGVEVFRYNSDCHAEEQDSPLKAAMSCGVGWSAGFAKLELGIDDKSLLALSPAEKRRCARLWLRLQWKEELEPKVRGAVDGWERSVTCLISLS